MSTETNNNAHSQELTMNGFVALFVDTSMLAVFLK